MPKAASTFTGDLRQRLKAKLGACPTCGHPRWDTLRGLAEKVGVSPATLTRWLNQGKEPDANTLNRAVRYQNGKSARALCGETREEPDHG